MEKYNPMVHTWFGTVILLVNWICGKYSRVHLCAGTSIVLVWSNECIGDCISIFFGDFYQHALESIVGNIVPALYMLSDL